MVFVLEILDVALVFHCDDHYIFSVSIVVLGSDC